MVQKLGFESVASGRIIRDHNGNYTHQLSMGDPTDQMDSGRCWIFAGCNAVRTMSLNRKLLPQGFQFSETYLYFYSMLEKANFYMNKVASEIERGSNPNLIRNLEDPGMDDGGWWAWFSYLVNKYGLVPREVMPDSHSSTNSEILNSQLQELIMFHVREMMLKSEKAKTRKNLFSVLRVSLAEAQKDLWTVLTTHLGTPIGLDQRFEFRKDLNEGPNAEAMDPTNPAVVRSFTPIQFAKRHLRLKQGNFITIFSNPFRPINTHFEIKDSSIGIPGPNKSPENLRMLNSTNARLMELVIASINVGVPVWFGADVRQAVHHESGIMHPDIFRSDDVYGFPPEGGSLPLKDRILYGTTSEGHSMVINGYDWPRTSDRVIKFRVENSWGEDHVFHLYPTWFENFVFSVVVPKSVLSPAELKALGSQPQEIS